MDISWYVAFGAAIVLGAAGGLVTDVGPWYNALRKPSWNPPNWAFGPAWTLILLAWAWAGALCWQAADPATRPWVLALFAINAVLHFAWSPLFFKLRRPDWALIEVVPFWLSIVALLVLAVPLSSRAVWLLAPYVAWVAFAAFLNLTIVRLNAPFGRG
jgi:translocator protein